MLSKKLIKFYVLIIILLGSFSFSYAQEAPVVKWKDGKKFVAYTIKKGDTWSSLSRRYKITIKDLQKVNPKAKELKFDQKIFIPYDSYKKSEKENTSEENPKSKANQKNESISKSESTQKESIKSVVENQDQKKADQSPAKKPKVSSITHKVLPGETLYGISLKYHITPKELANYNSIEVGKIKIGQVLKIPTKEQDNNNEETSNKIQVQESDNVNGSEQSEKEPPAQSKLVSSDTSFAYNPPTYTKDINGVISEQGVATWLLDGSSGKREKFYALHRTAPIGTIIKVINPMTKRYVYVKVVGVLPDTGDNHDVLIKVTQSAARRIGIVDSRFRVEISYGTKSKP